MQISEQNQAVENEDVCQVCGFNYTNIENIDFCPCCACEFGYEDSTKKAVHRYRGLWFNDEGSSFAELEFKPEGWNREMAIKQIKDNVPEELWKDDPLFK